MKRGRGLFVDFAQFVAGTKLTAKMTWGTPDHRTTAEEMYDKETLERRKFESEYKDRERDNSLNSQRR